MECNGEKQREDEAVISGEDGYKVRGRNVEEGNKAVKNSLTADLKPCYDFHAGRVGRREVDKIRLAGIGSARR